MGTTPYMVMLTFVSVKEKGSPASSSFGKGKFFPVNE
jgi:hypothetical protein